MLLVFAFAFILWANMAAAKAVFAHFMVGNTEHYTAADWAEDMRLAKQAHIDAFALNMAYKEAVNELSLELAFKTAAAEGFQLLFSFDYAGNGPWPKDVVIDYITNWAAWPSGKRSMDTFGDASYAEYLQGKPYMMPVSPWFYTNMPGYRKNWLWRGDDIWADRWFQVEWWQPEFVQIISWNDYGESHHIGPLRDHAMVAFKTGKAPFNYALQHDGWRDTLPFSIDRYKGLSPSIDKEGIVAWWRPNLHTIFCSNGGTTGNTASQLQVEKSPDTLLEDAVFYTAILKDGYDKLDVIIGGKSSPGIFGTRPEGKSGIFHGSALIDGRTGPVQVKVWRGGKVVAEVSGKQDITDTCGNGGLSNFDAYVASAWSGSGPSVTPPPVDELVCVNGTSIGDFEMLCTWTCGLGYCPKTACVCTTMGKQPTLPKSTGIKGYPAAGRDSTFSGLCGYACDYGYCPDDVCDTVEHPLIIPEVSPFTPDSCTSGTGVGEVSDLCAFSCKHGYCPLNACSCRSEGVLNLLDPTSTSNSTTASGNDYGLCAFACSRDYCPPVCLSDDSIDNEGYDPDTGVYTDSFVLENMRCKVADAPDNFDDLERAAAEGKIPINCWNRFALRILSAELHGIQGQFDLASKDYDDKFGYYAKWVKERINPQLLEYMGFVSGRGNKYFTCHYRLSGKDQSQQCPPPKSFWGRTEVAWTLRYELTDPDGFYKAVAADLGIEKSWVKFGLDTSIKKCESSGTSAGEIKTGAGTRPCRTYTQKREGFPMQGDDVEVPNPKEIIEAALPGIDSLSTVVASTYFGMATESHTAEEEDILISVAMPVYMLQSGIESMKEVKKIGAEVQKRDQERLIVMVLSIVLMVIPFVGEALGAVFASVAWVARLALLIGEAGNVALTVYDIVKDPASAPFAILGMLVGPMGLPSKGERVAFKQAGDTRRALKSGDLKLFGTEFVAKDTKVQNFLSNTCRKR
ncbi:Mutanase [Colletotrichum orbiculare MAFF 240422]|uniref:Mutanase n=1 Tax=Colletotrichum orbiculare (strain 104-T / ATCC 96160 / CBS 514.97 / LARS 414 / MAFF 240422) TaxID=1213857 RepID=A0A484FJU5_COLOR|nr:Mutanase [Colletotrichum orbiculare MAFF 240422]